MSLVAVAKDDITTMLQQESDLKRFGEGSIFRRGRVLTDIQRASKEKCQQMEMARSFAQVLQNQEALEMQIESEENPDFLYPEKELDTNLLRKEKE